MALRRYNRTPILGGGKQFGTSEAIPVIREAIETGKIRIEQEKQMQQGERLDILAGQLWGDSSLYWILAACSNIGWCLQVPPGIIIKIPNIDDVASIIG